MKPNFRNVIILGIALIPLALIIAAVPQNQIKPFKLTAEQMVQMVNQKEHFYSADVVADMLVQKDPSLQLIDVRSPSDFEKYSLPGAINIPLADLLSEQYEGVLNQDVKVNVFYSNGTLQANEAWMITRQLGYLNNFVLEGGLNYWFETIMNPAEPKSTSPDEEFAKYDFRKGAGQALGGGGGLSTESSAKPMAPQAPKTMITPKKKKAAGGC